MLFSSTPFLFAFLPVCLTFYYLACRAGRGISNLVLTIFSCAFYAWGEPRFVFVMLGIAILDWLMALLINQTHTPRLRMVMLGTAVILNLSVLVVFKYTDFILSQLNFFFRTEIPLLGIQLPIGISFFLFQALSYVVDVFLGNGRVQRNPIYVIEYIVLFPQLIAGPIVRYCDVAEELFHRKECAADFDKGCCRFILGLSKKVLLANAFAIAADTVFDALTAGQPISVFSAWIGAVSYSLQIYFDFSGYSDMAIGLGLLFGFHFRENFDFPYMSKSITEFWRRWHISLGTWFRDYVYIPLGGSRVNRKRLLRNLLVVWLLTGIWHGANWTFVVWGLMYFVLLYLEKIRGVPSFAPRIRTLFFVMIGWIIFRSPDLSSAFRYIAFMFGYGAAGVSDQTSSFLLSQYGLTLAVGIIGSSSLPCTVASLLRDSWKRYGYAVGCILLFLLSVSFLVKGAYNPFIYFNF